MKSHRPGLPAVIYLARHALAGQRLDSAVDDRLRALSEDGWRQARFLAERLESDTIGDILSSPFIRCIDTVRPLAARVGRQVMLSDVLEEGRRIDPLLRLLDEVPDGSVLCTHGDMLQGVVERLGVIGTGEGGCAKGSVWMLVRGRHGLGVVDVILPPPLSATTAARPDRRVRAETRATLRLTSNATMAHSRSGAERCRETGSSSTKQKRTNGPGAPVTSDISGGTPSAGVVAGASE